MTKARTASSSVARLIDSAWIADDEMNKHFIRFFVGAEAVGWLTPEFARHLDEWPRIFGKTGDGVRMADGSGETDRGAGSDALSATIAPVIAALAERDVIGGWRDELYPVRVGFGPTERTLLDIERAAARAFGITSHAVHVNGVTMRHGHPNLWIARRSPDKSIDPGMLDNLVGGGVPAGMSVRETLAKEAWEEAGLDAKLAARATDGRRLRIRRAVPEGLQSEVIFVHDLMLPATAVPRNQDGEVADFRLLSPDKVLELIERTGDAMVAHTPAGKTKSVGATAGNASAADAMTVDASLVTLDWLERNGHVKLPDTASTRAIYRTGGWA